MASSSAAVNPTWATQFSARYAERLQQTGAAPDPAKLKAAADRAAGKTS